MICSAEITITMSDISIFLAVLLAPFLAVFAQKQIEKWRENKSTKLWIFKTLMATRGAVLSANHVQALNMIDLEFSTKKGEGEVKRIWKEYLDHLGSLPKDSVAQKDALPGWQDKNQDYLADLLVAMGACFGYEYDRVYIKKGIYAPEGHAQDELEQRAIRVFLLQVLRGERSISTDTKLFPADDEAAAFGQAFQQGISRILDGTGSLSVEIKSEAGQSGSGDADKPVS